MMKNKGFPYWKYVLPTSQTMFLNLQKQAIKTKVDKGITIVIRSYPEDYMLVDHISNFYTEKIRIECSFNNKPTPMEIYQKVKNEDVYKNMGVLDKREYIYGLTRECNTFNVTFCFYVIKTLVGNNAVILDPSMGWGDRLIAALACHVRTYHGFDPNKKLQIAYKKIVKQLGAKKNQQIVFFDIPFEDSDLPKSYYDLALTSPPYYNLEKYSTDDTQSNIRNDSYKQWVDNFYIPYLTKMVNAVKTNGYIAVYIENITSDGISYPLCDLTFNTMTTLKVMYYTKIGLKIGKAVRYIYIWRKE